ncbi:unnamed protein product [Bemisia tabaci]|uniref:Uncharacterized protein n=1 Tax=Bemisia tabaci TaxID=7038 RepID=A0A9P0AKT4_BEMTA|nr:unnamed protein product [Bemisia tabaci]
MKTELSLVCALVCVVQGTNWQSRWVTQDASPAKRSLDIFDDFSENYDDSFEDFVPRRLVRSQSRPSFGIGFGPSPLNEADQLARVLQKRAPPPPPLAERLSLKPLGSKLALGKVAAVAEAAVVEDPVPAVEKAVVKVPAIGKNAIVWDKVELAKAAAAEKPVLVAGQAALAERKAAIDALLEQRKLGMMEKQTQLDQTVAQRKAIVQTKTEEVLAKIPALKKTEPKV